MPAPTMLKPVHLFLQIFIFTCFSDCQDLTRTTGGRWDLLQQSIGISAMHMVLLRNSKVIIFDRTDFGKSNLSLPDGKCRNDPNDTALQTDCTAHSAEYDPIKNSVRPLSIQTDVWCSSGAVASDGRLIQTGGFNDGDRVVRIFQPCDDGSCDWSETAAALAVRRWYATDQILPDGRVIIIGGRRQFNYEFFPGSDTPSGVRKVYSLPFLQQTKDPEENNLYPFVHLSIDGNLFIFANNRAILFDYVNNRVIRNLPPITGGDPRNYPSTGSSVLLPVKIPATEAEVLICGGAPAGSYTQATSGIFVEALRTCGRLKITDPSPEWSTENMPEARVMGDMLLIPTGDVLLINGASAGTAGWELGRNPVLNPAIYRPYEVAGSRFEVLNPSLISRMYHSTAVLLSDGRILVGGSNPHVYYNFTGVLFPTELSLEAFSPPYLGSENSRFRPRILGFPASLNYGKGFSIRFWVCEKLTEQGISVTMVAPSFNTHSFSMNQRLLLLQKGSLMEGSNSTYELEVIAPPSPFLAPPGYYLLFVVNSGIPSLGNWVFI